jgi:hypothetical protein
MPWQVPALHPLSDDPATTEAVRYGWIGSPRRVVHACLQSRIPPQYPKLIRNGKERKRA